MSNKIKSEDIFEGEIFKVLVDGAEVATKKIADLNEELAKSGLAFKKELGSYKPESVKDIEALLKKTKELNAEVEKQAKLNTAQSELNKTTRLEEIRLQQAREKAVDDFNKKEKKENERIAKETEKRLKNERDLADSYKQLTINTRDLKNESKRLGAEMLELEKQGKKNSAEYYKLSRQYKETTKSAIEGDKALKKLDSTVGDNFRNVGNYQKAIGGLKNAFMQLGLAFGAIDIIKSLVGTQVKLDSLNLALRNVSGSTKEYQANLSFIKDLSLSYGQDLISLADSYKNFIASTQSSNLSLAQRKRIYESVIKAGSSLALSNDNIKGSLLAISQMFSKGTVSAEELRQQLGERLPGAFGVMADSMGVTEAELGKLMKEGKVLADEVMPRFAIALERSFGKNAEKNLETLNGAFNVLKTNIALYFDQAQKNIGVNKVLAGILRGLGNNIGGLLDNIRQLVVAFVSFKAISIASEISMKAVNTGLLTMIKNAWKGKEAFTLLGMSLKGLTGIAVMEVLIKLTEYFIGLAKGTDLATEAYMRYKNATNVGNTNADKFIDKQRNILAIEREKLDLAKKAGRITDEQHKKLMKQKDDEVKANIKLEIQKLRSERSTVVSAITAMKTANNGDDVKAKYTTLDLTTAEANLRSIERIGSTAEKKVLQDLIKIIKADLDKVERFSNLIAKRIRIDTELPSYFSELRDMQVMNTKYSSGGGTPSKDIVQNTKELRDLNIEYNKTNIYLSRQVEILKDIKKIKADDKMQEAIDKTRMILDREEKSVNLTGRYNAKEVKTAIELEYKAKKEFEEAKFMAEKEDKKIRDTKTFNDELTAVEEQEKAYYERLRELNSDYYRRLADHQENLKLTKLTKSAKKQRDAEGEWLNKTGKQVIEKEKEIRKKADAEKAQVYENDVKRQSDTNLEIEGLQKNHEKNMANIKRDSAYKTDEELNKLELIRAQKRLEVIKNTAESVNNLIQKSLEHYINMAERRIDMLDKRMDRMSTQADFLREKAVAGNIQAQESLAVIDKQEIEAQKERMNEQRSIQRLQIAMTVFQAYSNNIQNAKIGENPFTKTLTDVTLLNQFVASLPTFIDGTETNIASALGSPHLQGQDGYVVRVDGSEKILNPQLSAMTGNMTTMEIAKLAEDFRRGDIMRKGDGAMQLNVGSWSTDMIVSELQDLKNVIKNKPESNIELGEIVGGVMHIMETKKTGNTKVRNISRFS